MSQLPNSWHSVPLLDVSELIRGVTYSKTDVGTAEEDDYVGVMRANNIQDRQFDLSDLVYVPRRLVADGQYVREGDVVVTTSSGSISVVGKAAQATREMNLGFGAFCGVLRPSSLLCKRFFGHYFSSERYRKYVASVARGVNINNLKRSHFEELNIPLAPLPEQKRIADKLDSLLSRVDSCRERFNRVPAILRRFRQSVLAAATSGKLTEEWRNASKSETSWEDVTLADVATEFSYGSSAKSSKVGRIPVLRMGNIQDGQLDWKDLVYTSNKEEIEKYRLEPGDILFNRTNSPELVGKTAVYDGNQPAIYAGYLIKVRCSDRVLPEYLNYCLNSPAGKDYCWKVKSDGVSQSNINAKKLAAFPFLLPPLEEQMQIVQQVEALYARASLISNHHSAAASRLEQLQKSSLAKAFRGDLVPQDPNDEPAAELLERIRELKGKETDESKKKGRSRMTRTTRKSNGQIRQLTLVLQENNGVMTPEKLLDAAGYTDESIEDFYLTLRQCIADGAIQDPRDHDNQIVLVQAQT